jgi:hypothetical protein
MRTFLASLAIAIFAAMPAHAGMVGEWRLTTFDPNSCNALRHSVRPSLNIERNGDKTNLRLMGLHMPSLSEDPKGLLGLYDADLKVSLNGAEVFTTKTLKSTGFLEIGTIGFEKLEALSAPGQLTFDLTGQGGQHETITYDSPGLRPAIDFLKQCGSN